MKTPIVSLERLGKMRDGCLLLIQQRKNTYYFGYWREYPGATWMTKGIIQKVFDRKAKQIPDYMIAFVLEELKHELVLEIGKELDSYHFKTSYERRMFRRWLIGDN